MGAPTRRADCNSTKSIIRVMATAQEVAEWMLDELTRNGQLRQETAVSDIALNFGYEFTYDNENGNLAIRRDVLAAFRRLTENSVVWDGENRLWRKRDSSDDPGRQQGY
jgi:uncharacterized protein DUF6953